VEGLEAVEREVVAVQHALVDRVLLRPRVDDGEVAQAGACCREHDRGALVHLAAEHDLRLEQHAVCAPPHVELIRDALARVDVIIEK
jgi:hypothetical protein